MRTKHIGYCSALVTVVALLSHGAADAAVLAEWKLGEAASGTFTRGLDSVGANYPANSNSDMVTNTGTPTYTTFTKPYSASDGRGISGGTLKSAVGTFSTSQFTGGFTMEETFKYTGGAVADQSFQTLISVGGAFYEIAIWDSTRSGPTITPSLGFTIAGSFGAGNRITFDNPGIFDGAFHHVVGIYDPALTINGSNNTFLYLDNTLVASGTLSLASVGTNKPVYLLDRDAGDPKPASATLDYARISSGVLPQAQWYNNIPEPASGLLASTGLALLSVRRHGAVGRR